MTFKMGRKKQIKQSWLLVTVMLAAPSLSMAQLSMELEEACYGDVALTENIVQLIETGSADTEVLNADEVNQVKGFLAQDEYVELGLPEQLDAVLMACSEGRLLQVRNQSILEQTNQ